MEITRRRSLFAAIGAMLAFVPDWAREDTAAAPEPAFKTTGLSYETLEFDAAKRTLDWGSKLGGWSAPDSHILGVAVVWQADNSEEQPYGIIPVQVHTDFIAKVRDYYGEWAQDDERFWQFVADQPWGKHSLRVYFTTIEAAVD